MNSCVHIYCGDGKGKTTAAVGLAVRALGRGQKVLMTRFLKTDDSGEVRILKNLPGMDLTPCEKCFGFYFRMSEEEKKEAAEYYSHLLAATLKKAAEGQYDMLILDEIMAACKYGLAEEKKLLEFLKNRPKKLEVILTGRDPSPGILKAGDYISEIHALRHPYEKGVTAREGIEY